MKSIGRVQSHPKTYSCSVYVRFHSDADRNTALQDFQCKRMEGHEIILNKTCSVFKDSKASICVKNLRNMTCSDFLEMCLQYGNVLRVARPRSPVCGLLAPYGFVQYEKEMEALLAIHSINHLDDKPTTSDYSFIEYEKKFEDFLPIQSKKAITTGKPTTPYIVPRTLRPLVMLEAVRFKKPLVDGFCDSFANPNSITVFDIPEGDLYKLYEVLASNYELLCTRFSIDHDHKCCTYFQYLNYEDKEAAMKDLYQLRVSVN